MIYAYGDTRSIKYEIGCMKHSGYSSAHTTTTIRTTKANKRRANNQFVTDASDVLTTHGTRAR